MGDFRLRKGYFPEETSWPTLKRVGNCGDRRNDKKGRLQTMRSASPHAGDTTTGWLTDRRSAALNPDRNRPRERTRRNEAQECQQQTKADQQRNISRDGNLHVQCHADRAVVLVVILVRKGNARPGQRLGDCRGVLAKMQVLEQPRTSRCKHDQQNGSDGSPHRLEYGHPTCGNQIDAAGDRCNWTGNRT